MVSGCKNFPSQYTDSCRIAKMQRWIVYRSGMHSRRGRVQKWWLFLCLQFRNAMSFSKTLVNNLSSLSVYLQVYTPFSDNMHHLSVSERDSWHVWCYMAAQVMFWGRSQSHSQPWDHVPQFKTRSQILIALFFCSQNCLFSVSPVFLLVFHPQPCIPPLHDSDGQMGLIMDPPFLSFLLSFPVLLLGHLSCGCLCKLRVLSYWEEMTSVKMTCTYRVKKITARLSIDSKDKSRTDPPLHKLTRTPTQHLLRDT